MCLRMRLRIHRFLPNYIAYRNLCFGVRHISHLQTDALCVVYYVPNLPIGPTRSVRVLTIWFDGVCCAGKETVQRCFGCKCVFSESKTFQQCFRRKTILAVFWRKNVTDIIQLGVGSGGDLHISLCTLYTLYNKPSVRCI